jgi:hypothetical protein
VLGAAVLVLAAGPAAAQSEEASSSYRAVIDRVDLEPASIGGLRLRVAFSVLGLQGGMLDLAEPRSITAQVGSSKLDEPYALGMYGATDAHTAIAIVLEANLSYAETLPNILSTLDDIVLSKLGDRTQVAVLSYGEATGTDKLGSIKSARTKLAQVASDGSAGEPALLDTLERALLLLKRAKTSPEGRAMRKLVLVIGDGRDRSGDLARVTALGTRAGKDIVRIHTFGYAPTNVRRPLLVLGELSKRSLGTFRWVRAGGADSWSGAFQQLRDEINKQYVLTYFVPRDADLAGKRLKLVAARTQTTSNEVRIPEAACGRDPCAGYCVDGTCVVESDSGARGVLGWVFLLGGIALGAIVVLGLIGFVLQRRHATGPGLPPGQFPGQFPGQMPGQMPGQYPGQMPGQFPGQVPGQAPGAVPAPQSPFKLKRSKPPKNQPIAPPAAPAPGGPVLLVMTGPRTGERIALQHGFTIGKAPTSNLILDDGYTSGQHAQIAMDQLGNCRLYDRNSTNGTFVNGVRVTEVVLDHGMSVRIGSTELRFLAR